jgi:sulfur carrier protein
MTITVNDDPVTLETPLTVAMLLEQYDLADKPCAVEVNKSLIPKREHATCTLNDGDEVEIVTLVGGG